MKRSLTSVVQRALPALSGSSLTYNAEKNLYLTNGYTSAAGNTYFRAIHASDRILIYYNIGIGYCRKFLNGITIYAWNGHNAEIIAQRSWGGCNYCFFNEYFAKEQCISMLKNYLASKAKALGYCADDRQLTEMSRNVINETHQKRIA